MTCDVHTVYRYGRIAELRVDCSVHGLWIYPPDYAMQAREFALSHDGCKAPTPRPAPVRAKSRRRCRVVSSCR